MSTRGNIAIRLKEEHLNTVLEFNENIKPNLRSLSCLNTVMTNAATPYLQIYNHHDSYPSHLGKILFNHYKTYDEVLNLILAGDTSGVGPETTSYYAPYDGYDDTKPSSTVKPLQNEEYLYVFENNQWFIQGKAYTELTPLTEEIIIND